MDRVTRPDRIATAGRAIAWASAHGIGATIATRWAFFHAPTAPPNLEDLIHMAIILALLAAPPVLLLFERLRARYMCAYSIAYTVTLLCSSQLLRFVELQDIAIPLISRRGLIPIYLFPRDTVIIGLTSTWLAWGIGRLRHGPIVIQDGTICPGCGYSLHGAVNRMCSECGREYTFQELETARTCYQALFGNADDSDSVDPLRSKRHSGERQGQAPP